MIVLWQSEATEEKTFEKNKGLLCAWKVCSLLFDFLDPSASYVSLFCLGAGILENFDK